jgi:hypothetical protein
MVNRMRLVVIAVVFGLGVLTSGCISIEQEIFLQPDGSGELLLLISLPDLPDDAKGGMSGGDPAEFMQKFKTEVAQKLPPTIKLKEAKELRRNGTIGFYALFQFKDLNDVQAVMANVMKESAQGLPSGGSQKPPEWTVKAEKRGGLTNFTQLFFADISDTKVETSGNVQVEVKPQPQPAAGGNTARAGRPAAKSARGRTTARAGRVPARQTATPPSEPAASGELKMEGMEGLAQMMLGAIKFRFVLHTPTPITNSNADLVLNGKTALWNCSLAAFAKEKKPIEMKASF